MATHIKAREHVMQVKMMNVYTRSKHTIQQTMSKRKMTQKIPNGDLNLGLVSLNYANM